jgi:ATP-dependent Clp protease ATP-binding subunit ClpX
MTATKDDLIHCSFCSKSQEEVAKLIAGPGVYICNDCIGLCNGILDGEDIVPDKPAVSPVSTPMLLAQLARITGESDSIVNQLRERGVDWDDISAALRKDDTT